MGRRTVRALRPLLALAGFGAVLAAYYWEILRPGADRAFGGDFASYFYPVTAYAAADLAAGRLPHWSPYVGVGYPLLADIEVAVLYPPRLVLALLTGIPSYQVLEGYALGHLLVAGLGMLALLRRIGLGVPAAVTGGLAFMLSGFFWAHAAHLSILQSSAWLPWIVVALDRAIRERSAVWTAGAGVLLTLVFLGGHPQLGFYTLLALAGLALGWPRGASEPRTARARLDSLARLAGAVALGLLLALPQLLPTAELAPRTTRQTPAPEFLLADSLPPWQLATFLIPRAFAETPLRQSMDEFYGYLGIGPLLLAVAAFGLRRDRWTRLFGGLGLAALFVALGGYNPLYRHGLQWLPGFTLFRAPARALLFIDFALAALAGLGLDALAGRRPGQQARRLAVGLLAAGGLALLVLPVAPRVTAALAPWVSPGLGRFYLGFVILLGANVLLVLIALRAPRRAAWWGSGLVVVLLLDLFLAVPRGLPWHPSPPEGFWPPEPPAVERLRDDPAPFRVWNEGTLVGLDGRREANAGLVYRIPVLSPYPRDTSLDLWRVERLRDLLGREAWRHPALLDLLNVKYVAVHRDRAELLARDARFRRLTATLWENRSALPHAFIVEELVVAGHPLADPAALLTLDPRRAALVEDAPACARALGQAHPGGGPPPVEIRRYAPEWVRLGARLTRPGFLVLTDLDYPGWRATVDGRRAKIYRTDFLFRGLCLEPGRHLVEFRYRPTAFWRGATVALIALLGAGVAVVVQTRPRRDLP